ncbi:LytR/AlgR family response regulator transcription factor [Dyadobacter arcticus]|uniref:Two-component system LytT family response regulator n=1 Tax=Dyadobacter arcticus TaxID=1078754 RepID=A0ABX0USD4_9BACT|nr:LytTR family DNA-binding domain-containing protein [Dyadobacter arcticus]NIJ54560.1 two-component system LytT family response regulator [Dyadobacter arcticus]
MSSFKTDGMVSAVIVDDEPDCCESLATLLELYCPNVKIIDICFSAESALKSLRANPPQILFLDIEMPFFNGFELLEKLGDINFQLIFTTSYNQYAIKAIRFSALEYLLKPVDREELRFAVQKAVKKSLNPLPHQLKILLERIRQPAISVNKIAIPTLEGFKMVLAESVVRCEADGNYTHLYLRDKSKLTASRNLKDMEEMLEDYPFIRVHNSYLVNINEIDQYVKGEGGYLVMSDASIVNVSRSRKELLLKKIIAGN